MISNAYDPGKYGLEIGSALEVSLLTFLVTQMCP